MSESAAKAVIFFAISAANAKVYSMAKENPNYHGMGTTLVLAVVLDEWMHIVNIGDSRIYMVEKAVQQDPRPHPGADNGGPRRKSAAKKPKIIRKSIISPAPSALGIRWTSTTRCIS